MNAAIGSSSDGRSLLQSKGFVRIPRLRSDKYDWHRGLDLDTDDAINRPVYAITCGVVKSVDDEFNGTLVIEHYRDDDCSDPGSGSCGDDGCYYSRYKHLADVHDDVDTKGAVVEKGQYIGKSGKNCAETSSCYEHLHFEIRESPGAHDKTGRGQRDAIHPLQVLPYDNSDATDNITLTIDSTSLDLTTTPPTLTVDVGVTIPNDWLELDLVKIGVNVYDNDGTALVAVAQPNPGSSYTTPEGLAYEVHPPFFDMELWSRQYNYKDNSKLPYSYFEAGGVYMSPYADSASPVYDSGFPSSYDADFHLEAKLATDDAQGDFNGVEVAPGDLNLSQDDYRLDLKFTKLAGPPSASRLCVKVFAVDALGQSTDENDVTSGNCTVP